MTTMTPPPLPPQPAAPPTPPSGGSSSQASKVIAILAIVFGVVVVIATATGAIVTSVISAGTQTVTRTLDVDGIDELDLDVSAGTVRVEFGDVAEATLEVTGGWGADRWTFTRDGDELVVATPERLFGIGWMLGATRATLTLPQELEDTALDAQITLSAGELDATGNFAELDLDVSAGTIEVSGRARELSVELSAGRADVELADVAEADLSVSAGQLVSRLSGSAPSLVEVSVSAGSLTLTVPDETYDVSVDVSAGGVDNRLQTSSSADHRIVGEVSAGQLTLRPRD